MTNRTAGEGRALAVRKLLAAIREKHHVFEIFACLVLAFNVLAFVLNVTDQIVTAGDFFHIATKFLILDIQAAQKRPNVVGVAVRKSQPRRFFVELKSVALLTVIGIGDRTLVLAA